MPGEVRAEERVLIIESVTCVKPSEILGSEVLVGALAGLAAAGFVGMTAGVGAITLTSVAAAAGGSATAKDVIEQLALDFGGSPDDLYIMVDGEKVWPNDSSRSIKSQQTIRVDYETTFDDEAGTTVTLWEWDVLSDDPLGTLLIRDVPDDGISDTAILFGENADGIYTVTFSVE